MKCPTTLLTYRNKSIHKLLYSHEIMDEVVCENGSLCMWYYDNNDLCYRETSGMRYLLRIPWSRQPLSDISPNDGFMNSCYTPKLHGGNYVYLAGYTFFLWMYIISSNITYLIPNGVRINYIFSAAKFVIRSEMTLI